MSNENDEINNFIPLCAKVYLLSEEESKISQDIPFLNTHSGEISIIIKSKSDIFIRNSYVEGDDPYVNSDENIISTEFCHYNGVPYIPATSIKGMISNIIELFSYSKLSTRIDESFLEKLAKDPYKRHLEEGLDLRDALFGTTELKGRVYFSHCKATSYEKIENPIETILMSPEPKKNKIGWKHYPIKNNASPELKKKNENIITKFKPLNTGSTFEGKVRFHNLRDFELGALLSALSFHDTSNCFHTIGMGKAQGYGKISLSFEYTDLIDRLKDFEIKMNEELGEGKHWWHQSRYIKEVMKRHSQGKTIKSLLSKHEAEILHEEYTTKQEEKNKENKENKLIHDNYINEILTSENFRIPTPKKLKKAIEAFFKSAINLDPPKYYDINHVVAYLQDRQDDIPYDICEEYKKIFSNNSYNLIVEYLKKREKGASDNELGVLYSLLNSEISNA